MPRRGENIRKRKDGRWEGRYFVFESGSGRNVSRSVYAKTYGDVKEKLAAAKLSVQEPVRETAGNGKICFCHAAEGWLAAVKASKKHATYVKYCSIYQTYIKGCLEDCALSALNETVISKVFQDEVMERCSDSLKKSISCVLNQILAYAASCYHAERIRYSYKMKKAGSRQVQTLSQAEQIKLLQCLYDEMDIYKLGILICISTGLRLGEICALKWDDIDLDEKMIYVNATVQRIAADGQNSRTILLEGEPKSVFSRRGIPLSDEMVKLLSAYHNSNDKYAINSDKPMEPRTYQNKFQKYLQQAGIGNKNFHILRHTFATNCINSGTDIKSLSEILGHSDVKITLNCYVHPTIETKRDYMNSLSDTYGQYLCRHQQHQQLA